MPNPRALTREEILPERPRFIDDAPDIAMPVAAEGGRTISSRREEPLMFSYSVQDTGNYSLNRLALISQICSEMSSEEALRVLSYVRDEVNGRRNNERGGIAAPSLERDWSAFSESANR